MSIIGYTWRADVWCDECIATEFAGEDTSGFFAEDLLDDAAMRLGIDRYDEHSYDSDEFPKVILGPTDPEQCTQCGEEL